MLRILRAKKRNEHARHMPGRFEKHLLFSILGAGAPGIILALVFLWHGGYELDHKIEASVLVLGVWLQLSFSTQENVVNSLRVLSNVLSSVKNEDSSFLATNVKPGDAFGDLALEINSLSRALAEERLATLDATSLLRKVMAEAGAIIFAFSPDGRVRLVNRSGWLFLGKPEQHVVNRTARELGIEDLVHGPTSEVISRADSTGERRWIVRRANFRQNGEPHSLVVLAEASEALRAEERMAWQRLIRVLSHEINNSLAPIRTIARTLDRMTSNTDLPAPISENLKHGLEVIHDRADSLNRFLQSYTRVAKIPPPTRRAVIIDTLLTHVCTLESRLVVNLVSGPKVQIFVDPDQLEQVLINLIKNAVDAVLIASEHIGAQAVTIFWAIHGRDLEIFIRDEGIGLTQTENLFVPFYTTKETGFGIGLLLSRQIIEAHKGTLDIKNRKDRRGCEVEIKLPLCVLDVSDLSNSAHEDERQAPNTASASGDD